MSPLTMLAGTRGVTGPLIEDGETEDWEEEKENKLKEEEDGVEA